MASQLPNQSSNETTPSPDQTIHQTDPRTPSFEQVIFGILSLILLLLLLLMVLFIAQNMSLASQLDPINLNGDNAITNHEAEILLNRAQDAVSSAELVIGFLEGASVLLALALGAAALVGYQNSRELRKELRDELEKIQKLGQEIENNAVNIKQAVEVNKKYAKIMENTQPILQAALQTNLELRMQNFQQAYEWASQVRELDSENTFALYITGWLQLQYVKENAAGEDDRLLLIEEGIHYLKQAKDLTKDSPSAMAALGVGLRRLAHTQRNIQLQKTKVSRDSIPLDESILMQAESELGGALAKNDYLLDLNGESFWGALAATRRDLGRTQAAIDGYNRAFKITPRSSYPIGNLAALYLQLAAELGDDAKTYDETLINAYNAFQKTYNLAIRENTNDPSDYFVLMDLAMSAVMLAITDDSDIKNQANQKEALNQMARDWLDDADEWLDNAIDTKPTITMYEVSLGGWRRLERYTPESADWDAIRAKLASIIKQLNREIEKQSP